MFLSLSVLLSALLSSPIVNGSHAETLRSTVVGPRQAPKTTKAVPRFYQVQSTSSLIQDVTIGPTDAKTNDTLKVAITPSAAGAVSITSYSYQWRKNGEVIAKQTGATLDLSLYGIGDRGDRISCAVTARDAQGNSESRTSNEVTIQSTSPTLTSVTVVEGKPGTNGYLLCNVVMSNPDVYHYSPAFQWKKNGVVLPDETGSGLALNVAGNGDRDDVISCVVTVDNGYGEVLSKESEPFIIQNTPPLFTWMSVMGTDDRIGRNHYYTDSLLRVESYSTDDDGDVRTFAYTWKKNGVVLEGEIGAALDLSKPGYGDRGDTITLIVTANDGHGGITSQQSSLVIENAPAKISNVVFNPLRVRTNDSISLSAIASDPDNDPVTLSYQWIKVDFNFDTFFSGPTLDLSLPGHGDRGDSIYGVVTAFDGTTYSGGIFSDSRTPFIRVESTPPEISSVSLSTLHPGTNSLITASASATDIDGDTPTFSYQWKNNGVLIPGETKSQLALSNAGNGDDGDQISVVVTANDGHEGINSKESEVAIVQSGSAQYITLSQSVIPENQPIGTSVGTFSVTGANASQTYTYTLASGVGGNDNPLFRIVGNALQTAASFDFETINSFSVRVRAVEAGGAAFEMPLVVSVSDVRENRPPSARVTLSPFSPTTDAVLQATPIGTDADGDPLTYSYLWTRGGSVIDGETNPVLDLEKGGNGDKGEVISVRVTPFDGEAYGVAAIASVKVVNSAPVLTATRFTGRENKVLASQIPATDADKDTMTLTLVQLPLYGKLNLQSSGAFTYTPKANWNGTDSFVVQTTDTTGAVAQATMTLVIKPANGAPVAVADTLKGKEDVPLSVPASLLLRNDRNGENKGEKDALKITKVSAPKGFPGALKLDVAKQTLLILPRPNWNGTTSFTYVVADSGKATASAQVKLQIVPVNDAPVTESGRLSVVSGTLGELELHANDVEGSPLTFSLGTRPKNGEAQVVRVGAKWMLRYVSKPAYSGTDSLTVTSRDGRLSSAPALITITVKPNSAPQLVSLSPNRGDFSTGSDYVFEQKVRDANGTAHLDAVALVISNSSVTADTRGGAALWFDALTNHFTITTDNGKTTLPPVALDQILENSQLRVTLGAEDVTRASNGLLTLKWHITFKKNTGGSKSLWSRVEDLGGLSAGFTLNGQIMLKDPVADPPPAPVADSSAASS